jgi:hypothetical protein
MEIDLVALVRQILKQVTACQTGEYALWRRAANPFKP